MPTTDWQFWVVTAIALAAAWRIGGLVLGLVRPWLRRGKAPVKRASLTISARSGREG